jgi:hypothetical protein
LAYFSRGRKNGTQLSHSEKKKIQLIHKKFFFGLGRKRQIHAKKREKLLNR